MIDKRVLRPTIICLSGTTAAIDWERSHSVRPKSTSEFAAASKFIASRTRIEHSSVRSAAWHSTLPTWQRSDQQIRRAIVFLNLGGTTLSSDEGRGEKRICY